MFLASFHKTILDRANSERSRKDKVRCDGVQPSCGTCSKKGLSCRYECTTTELVAMRADSENRRLREACERGASAPQHRDLQPRSEGPVKGLRELAAAPVLSPPHSEQSHPEPTYPEPTYPEQTYPEQRYPEQRYPQPRYNQPNYTQHK